MSDEPTWIIWVESVDAGPSELAEWVSDGASITDIREDT